MDYQLENLGADRFQQLCQALLIKQFPDLLCLPVGQPDGGRDALTYFGEPRAGGFLVYQVKFVKRPLAEPDPHKWLTEIIKGEAPKIQHLIPRGAKHYYLLTNVPGTAHLDTGSIDKVHHILRNMIEIPADCWWRDDLCRRLDHSSELRWAYPELMTGMDLLQLFVEEGLSESRKRRMSALKACLRDQYESDKEVRFKQVELQNKLLDLFIDVPLVVRDTDHRKFRRIYFGIMHRLLSQPTDPDDIDSVSSRVLYERDERSSIGAASFLLDPQVQEHLPTIVLEGAPGQGKSTIAQYICQVHRMRLLNETSELEATSDHHKLTPLRIPIKVDSRDLATWLSRKDPFSSDESEVPSTYWRRSLEAFLTELIRHHSGGSEFTVADLHAITRLSAILLVFDGLDEVADISRRQEVVDEIIKGVNRLKENAASLQVVVTSRPAAFANSPGLPGDTFLYCQLEALTRPLHMCLLKPPSVGDGDGFSSAPWAGASNPVIDPTRTGDGASWGRYQHA